MCAWVLLGSGDLDLSHLKLFFYVEMGVGIQKRTGTGICHHKQWFRETEWRV